jgi:hypothetical protein
MGNHKLQYLLLQLLTHVSFRCTVPLNKPKKVNRSETAFSSLSVCLMFGSMARLSVMFFQGRQYILYTVYLIDFTSDIAAL